MRLYLCDDCANAQTGDFSFLDFFYDEGRSIERMDEIEDGMKRIGTVYLTDEYDEFSNRPCDCCGTALAGQRTVFTQAEAGK